MRRGGLQQVRWLSESAASLGSECNAISPGGGLLGDRKWDTHFQCPQFKLDIANTSFSKYVHGIVFSKSTPFGYFGNSRGPGPFPLEIE
jgi:hypothetical protein